MGSLYLNRLTREERKELEHNLWEQQSSKCFISGKVIELGLHEVDIDHIIPTRDSGKDDPSNFALTLLHYNRSKQASDLRIARVLARLDGIREEADGDDRGANLGDVLEAFGGAARDLRVKLDGESISYVAPGTNGENPVVLPLHQG